jgi:pimeloyl-ACP methyl ester carboxylesterase
MINVILPGYSAHNKEWAEEVAKELKVEGEVRPIFWDHWTDPDSHLKPKEKSRLIIGVTHGEPVNIIAKSVGTLVAAYIAREIPDKINKIILCGIPSTSGERLKIFQEAFGQISAKRIICFQNEKDPFASPEEISKFMSKVNFKIKVKSMPRSDHHYPYYPEFNKFLSS